MMINGGWMMGPAFIKRAESASPQASMTPGNARPITASAWLGQTQREDAGRQPLGADGDRRLEGAVLAREPRQRAGLGERNLGPIAGIAHAALANKHRAERSRRQKDHLAGGEVGREPDGDIVMGGCRRRADDELGTAHGLGDFAP